MKNASIENYLVNNGFVLYLWFLGLLAFGYLLYCFLTWIGNLHKKLHVMQITFPVVGEGEELEYIEKMKVLFDSMYKRIRNPRDKIFIEVLKDTDYIKISAGTNNRKIIEMVRNAFTQIENCKISSVEEDIIKAYPNFGVKSIYATLPFYPISKNPHFFDSIIHFLDSLPETEIAGVVFVLRGVRKKWAIDWRIHSIDAQRKKEKRITYTSQEQKKIDFYQGKLAENIFKTKIYTFASNKERLPSLTGLFSTLNKDENELCAQVGFRFFLEKRFIAPDSLFSWILPIVRETEGSYFTTSELAYLFHPTSVIRASFDTKLNKNIGVKPEFLEERKENILIGTTQTVQNDLKKVYFPEKNLPRHTYVIGKTGRGKSSLLVSIIASEARKTGKTIFVIDPDGDLLTDTIDKVKTTGDIEYFNINKTDRVFTVNPAFCFRKTRQEKSVIKDVLLDIIRRETEEQTGDYTTGVQTQSRIDEMLDMLIEFPDAYYAFLISKKKLTAKKAEEIVHERQLTLNDLPFFLNQYRNYNALFNAVFTDENTVVGQYVKKEYPQYLNNQFISNAVQARLKQLTHSSLRHIFEGNKFDIKNAVDSGNIYLFPFPVQVYGEAGTRLLIQLLFSFLWMYKRTVEEKDRKETLVVIDEFQNAQIKEIPDIISRGRKQGLYMLVSNQYFGQLKKQVMEAIIGNIGTLIAFTVGADEFGTKLLAKAFGGRITENELTQLPKHTAILSTDRVQTDDDTPREPVIFNFQTIPVQKENKDLQFVEELNTKTLKKYGEKIDDLEKRIIYKQNNPLKYFTDGI